MTKFDTLTFYSRTNLLLGLGLAFAGIITPCLQIALAYLYFRRGHIWSIVLNAHLENDIENDSSCRVSDIFYTVKHLIMSRVMY